MATQSVPKPQTSSFLDILKNPTIATPLILVYLAVVVFVLVTLNRADLMFPTWSTLAFPLFILSPFVIMAAPVDNRFKNILIGVLVIVVMPLIGLFDSAYLELAIQICIFAALALGLNIVVGFAGLLDLGYIAFFAVGAYTWGMFTSQADTVFNLNGWLVPSWAFYLFLFFGVGAAALGGILLGLPVLRLRGDYLAIVTLGFGEMIRVLARNLDQPVNLTNGSQGLFDVASPPVPQFWTDLNGGIASLFSIPVTNLEPASRQLLFYFIAIAIIAIVIVVARRLDDSPIGRAWTAIREDEVAAIAMGVPLVRMKLLAFATGASFAGAVGVLYAAKQTFVSPESFSLIQSISILAMVIVGGLGGIRGVILGACVVTLLNLQVLKNLSLQLNALRQIDYVVPIINFHITDWPTQLEPAKYERLVFGLLLIIMMIFRPSGILPEPRRRLEMQKDEVDAVEEDENTVTAAPSSQISAD
jgi:branched-chain amino acid transport system permease protein